MSRSLLRSALELRTPIARLPPAFLLPIRSRSFTQSSINQSPQIIEPAQPNGNGAAPAQFGGTPRSPTPPPPAAQNTSTTTPPSPSTIAATTTAAAGAAGIGEAATATATAGVSAAPDLDPSVRALLPLLAAQSAHYVTIHIHGKPYLVTAGDRLRLPFKMPGVVPGDVLRLNRASVLGSRDFTLRGEPHVDERLFECRAVVLGTEAEPMRIMIKKKQRNRRKKHVRSKHKYTILRISDLRINRPEDMEL